MEPNTQQPERAGNVGSTRVVGPRAWIQQGFVVVSDANGLPLVHEFHPARWMAESRVRMITAELPEHLRKSLTIITATLHYEWPNARHERRAVASTLNGVVRQCVRLSVSIG